MTFISKYSQTEDGSSIVLEYLEALLDFNLNKGKISLREGKMPLDFKSDPIAG